MEINIRITEKDLQENPAIFDIIKGFTVKEETPAEPTKADFLEKRMNIPEPEEAPVAEPVEETQAEAEKAVEEPEELPTLEEVRAAVSAYAKKHSAAQAKEILLKHGASKVTDLKPDVFKAVMEDCEV